MKVSTFLSAAALAAALVGAVCQCGGGSQSFGAGSSAMWQTASTGAWNQLAGGPAAGAQYFTIKGTCTGTNNCAQISDSRGASIVPQSGNIWIVWNAAQTEVWAYISVDSVVGNRVYFARTASGTKASSLQLDPALTSAPLPSTATTNLITYNLWGCDYGGGAAPCSGSSDYLPQVVYNKLNNALFTAGFTDIRPEDAYYASCRVLNPLDATGNSAALGYGSGRNCTSATGSTSIARSPHLLHSR